MTITVKNVADYLNENGVCLRMGRRGEVWIAEIEDAQAQVRGEGRTAAAAISAAIAVHEERSLGRR